MLHWINEYWHPMRKEDDASPAHTGLGLIIVMELLEQMKGRLKVENKERSGAIVKIELTPC
jgi:K+-sensing histidine kinase KdpD